MEEEEESFLEGPQLFFRADRSDYCRPEPVAQHQQEPTVREGSTVVPVADAHCVMGEEKELFLEGPELFVRADNSHYCRPEPVAQHQQEPTVREGSTVVPVAVAHCVMEEEKESLLEDPELFVQADNSHYCRPEPVAQHQQEPTVREGSTVVPVAVVHCVMGEEKELFLEGPELFVRADNSHYCRPEPVAQHQQEPTVREGSTVVPVAVAHCVMEEEKESLLEDPELFVQADNSHYCRPEPVAQHQQEPTVREVSTVVLVAVVHCVMGEEKVLFLEGQELFVRADNSHYCRPWNQLLHQVIHPTE
ncbi:uncharacterized protein LOC111074911 [Drosophila obscura]|uniref:uncharacterized protein LOC111074911 n=1 Tax=Drosophila obscura TaxID=7282 RepID=UPI001BB264FD|nr:uncharacterized protein LOC111074911 [Drosophila obscura]